MAERPSDEWFRSAGWTEFATCWVKDYDSLTFRASKGIQRVYTDANGGGWYWEAVNADDPKALHAAWEAEQKRRETPLDPDGWTHLKKCGEHTSGYRYMVLCGSNPFYSIGSPDGVFFTMHKVTTLDCAIAACNQHAKENGVKSC